MASKKPKEPQKFKKTQTSGDKFKQDLADAFGLGGRESVKNEGRASWDEINPGGAGTYKEGGLAAKSDSLYQQGNALQAPTWGQALGGRYLTAGEDARRAEQARAQTQGDYISQLQDAAAGRGGPSAAEMAMGRASADAQRQQMAMAAGSSGGPGGIAASMRAQNQVANAQGQLQQDLGVQRAQEQMAARGMLGGAIAQARGQDLAAGQSYFGAGQGIAEGNRGSMFKTEALRQGYYGMGNEMAAARADQARSQVQDRSTYALGLEGVDASRYGAKEQSDAQRFGSTMSGAGAAIGALAMMSDVRAKTQVAPDDGQISEGFRELPAYQYHYKQPQLHGEGQQNGIMAQDLEKNPAMRGAVQEAPDGSKIVDGGKLATVTAAEVANQRRELDELKQRGEPEISVDQRIKELETNHAEDPEREKLRQQELERLRLQKRAEKPSAGQKAGGQLAKAFGAFGANMTGGRNVAGDMLDSQEAEREKASRELADLEEENRKDAELLERLRMTQANQVGAIKQPQVAYPYVSPYTGPQGNF